MHSSLFLATLAATAVMATPLRARQAPTSSVPEFAPAPTGSIPSEVDAAAATSIPSGADAPPAPIASEMTTSDEPAGNGTDSLLSEIEATTDEPAGNGPESETSEIEATIDEPASNATDSQTSGIQGGAPSTDITGELGVPGSAPNPPVPEGFIAELKDTATTVQRWTKIKERLDDGSISLKFDHNPSANPGITPGKGGQVDLATVGNFPIALDYDIATAVIFFQPCGLNTPHIHPRATEQFTLATDSNMTTGFVLENGLTDEFTVDLSIWQSTLFPQGSIHWQQNNDCEPATGVAALNSQDPGASSIAQNFVRFSREDVVLAALGVNLPDEINASNFADFKEAIPAPLALGVESCLKRCNIKF